jgi:hypothetical protein
MEPKSNGDWIQIVNPLRGDNPDLFDHCSILQINEIFWFSFDKQSVVWLDCNDSEILEKRMIFNPKSSHSS